MRSSLKLTKLVQLADAGHRSTCMVMIWWLNQMVGCAVFLAMPTRPSLFLTASISMTFFNKVLCRSLLIVLLTSLLDACGGGSTAAAVSQTGNGSAPVVPITSTNAIAVIVDSGVAGNAVNQLFASVTLCQPGNSSRCQTIDHLLIDTGSSGLRVFSAVIPASVNLPRLTGVSGMQLLDCVQFIDNTFAWGPVAAADVVLGGKTASGLPIQIMADPAYKFPNSSCSSRGRATQLTTAASLGANGILGLGLFKDDCGADCTTNANNGSYFTCTTTACSTTVASTAVITSQVQHPVPLFATDNNGLLIDLPPVAVTGATPVNGLMTFGIGTQTNNQMTSASVLTTDALGYITTQFAGTALTTSFIDSGSNGLFFDSATLPACGTGGNANGFYCPSAPANFSATLLGRNGQSTAVHFSVLNAETSFANPLLTALPALGGSIGNAQTFDWGLPFFYGRKVYLGIEGAVTSQGTGPFYAF